jgi:hypothetical protein
VARQTVTQSGARRIDQSVPFVLTGSRSTSRELHPKMPTFAARSRIERKLRNSIMPLVRKRQSAADNCEEFLENSSLPAIRRHQAKAGVQMLRDQQQRYLTARSRNSKVC